MVEIDRRRFVLRALGQQMARAVAAGSLRDQGDVLNWTFYTLLALAFDGVPKDEIKLFRLALAAQRQFLRLCRLDARLAQAREILQTKLKETQIVQGIQGVVARAADRPGREGAAEPALAAFNRPEHARGQGAGARQRDRPWFEQRRWSDFIRGSPGSAPLHGWA